MRARVRLGCASVARRARDGFALTIVISISVQDGVVLASDSAVEHRGQVYYSAEKTLQLIKGLPIGVLIAGDAAINNKAFIDVLKDFGAQCAGRDDDVRASLNRRRSPATRSPSSRSSAGCRTQPRS